MSAAVVALAALNEINNWLVCSCIATPEDMAQSFPAMQEVAAKAIAALEAVPGWQLVPPVPTQTMCQAGQDKANEWRRFPLRISPIYQSMLAAAPKATT